MRAMPKKSTNESKCICIVCKCMYLPFPPSALSLFFVGAGGGGLVGKKVQKHNNFCLDHPIPKTIVRRTSCGHVQVCH